MKKIYMMLAALAAMTMTVQAQDVLQGSLQVGDYDNASELYDGSYFDMAPTNFYLAHTGSQMLYTPTELADMQDKANVQVNKLSFKFLNEGIFDDMVRDIKVYLQAIDETTFPVNPDNNKKQFFAFDNLVLDYEETFPMLDYYYEDGELVFDLANAPFSLPAGKTLLVTAVFDAQDDDNWETGCAFYVSDVRAQAMTYTHNTVSFLDFAETDDFPDVVSGTGTNVYLPVTKIDYTYTTGEGLKGDVDGNGEVDVNDVNILINIMLGKANADDYPGQTDIDGQEGIDAGDVNALVNILLGKS